MKNKLELFVDKVNEYGGYAEIFKTKGKVKRIMVVFSLNKPQFYVARLKYGCIVVSAVCHSAYCYTLQQYREYGNYAIKDFDDMKVLEERLENFFIYGVHSGERFSNRVGLFLESKAWLQIMMIYIALIFGYYPIE